ncbi:hypothetical protein BDA99DRAFT_529154 [Phascolomyces articulosus]|uniref:histone deacetylase n=1 Tax=Phascolomyces articulosus TaxID=60185 RepID=A0AAD5JWQ1_9FUNG|nr:hypothetical protein BDA99DRAFT_529154 [Phascolomyces articulosus]
MENEASSSHMASKSSGSSGIIAKQSSKRSRQNQDYVEPVIPAKRMGGIIVRSGNTPIINKDNSNNNNASVMTGQVGVTNTHPSYLTRPPTTTTRASIDAEDNEEEDPSSHIETLIIPPHKIRKTLSNQSSQQQKTLSFTSAATTATANSSQSTSPPSPTPLRQVPAFIDLTLDESDDDDYSPPKPSAKPTISVPSSSTGVRRLRTSSAPTSQHSAKQVKKERTTTRKSTTTVKKEKFNFLGLESSDTDSDGSSSFGNNDRSTKNKQAMEGKKSRSSKLQHVSTSKFLGSDSGSDDNASDSNDDDTSKHSLRHSTVSSTIISCNKQQQHDDDTLIEEDELDEDDDADYQPEGITTTVAALRNIYRRGISAPSNDDSEEEHAEYEENEELESIRMKFTEHKHSYGIAGTSDIDELNSLFDGEEDNEQQQPESFRSELQRQQQQSRESNKTNDYNGKERQSSIKSQTENNNFQPQENSSKTITKTSGATDDIPEFLDEESEHDDLQYKEDQFIDIGGSPSPPPLSSPQNRRLAEIVSKETDPNISINTISTITSTSTLTPCTSPALSSGDQSPVSISLENGLLTSSSQPSSTCSSISSSSHTSRTEQPRAKTKILDPARAAAPLPSTVVNEGDTDTNHPNNDDDADDDFYSASQHEQRQEQSGTPMSEDDEEFVTAELDRSSTADMFENDTDYKRLPRYGLKTGYVYDVIMSLHAQLGAPDEEPHPEDPRRIYSIYKCMEENGLLKNCTKLPIRKATEKEILSIHDPWYIKSLRQTEEMSRKELEKEERKYNSIYMNAHSHEAALYSAGGVIEACSAVVTDKVQNAFAIVRPPGHHAEFDKAMGFCLMNNVAIAARYCKTHFPYVERIMILDWDIHFGNGTQQLTSRDSDTLYMSLHRYEEGLFYPQDKHGGSAYTGRGKGKGRTVNIPWPSADMTDGDYLYAFRQVVMPIAMEFAPSLVIVSAGFDAAEGDHIGECHVTPAGYGQMTHMLKSLANGRIVLALEGGYNLDSIAKSAHACMSVLLGEAPEIPSILTPSPECVETIQQVKKTQAKYWECLKY